MEGVIELSELLQALREEVAKAKHEAENSPSKIRFNLEDIEIELSTTVTKEIGGEAESKIKFWVLDGGAKASGKFASEAVQKFTFKFSPSDLSNPEQNNIPMSRKIKEP